MPKPKKRKSKNKRKQSYQPRPKKPQQEQAIHFDKKRIVPSLWNIFVGFAIILGVVVALYPKPQVEPIVYLDPKNPLKTLFKITNDGFLPLNNVKILCGIKEVKGTTGGSFEGADKYKSRLFNPSHVADKLKYGESITAFCAVGALKFPYNIESAEIAIIVEFSPPLIPVWRMDKTFPFTTQKK